MTRIMIELDDKDLEKNIPTEVIDKCKFDDRTGAVVGHDFVDQYLRFTHNIWCKDWWVKEDYDTAQTDDDVVRGKSGD